MESPSPIVVPSSPSFQRLAALSELRSCFDILCEFLITFPVEADEDPSERGWAKQRFSKFRFCHIRDYAFDVADEAERRRQRFEVASDWEGLDDSDLVLSKAKPARLKLANLSDDVFRLVVVDIYNELMRRYFGEDSPFETHLRRQLNAQTAELYFAAGTEACEAFEKILGDKAGYQKLLTYRDEQAQTVLDLMSMLVDHPSLAPQIKCRMLKAIMKLSQNSFHYPQSLLVEGIKRDDIPYSCGKFGDVYRGTFRGQKVGVKVIKIYRRSDTNRIFKLFSREAMLWAHLSHPNILPFYGIYRMGDIYGRLALISPWMEHGHLRGYLERDPDADRFLLLSDIVNGLQYLHENGIVHGDLKGDNILITSSGRACLADFGLSNIVQTQMAGWSFATTLVHNGGTLGWEAPELLHDNAVPTVASDTFALSMVFYEVFTGKVPFYEARYPAAVISKLIMGYRPTKPSLRSPAYSAWGLCEEVWELIERGWEANPNERPPLSEFLQVLSRRAKRLDVRSKDEYGGALPPSKFRDAMNGAYRRFTVEEIAHVVSGL